MKKWIHAARLRTLPLALSVGVLAISVCNNYSMNAVRIGLLLLTIILLQVLSNFANDYGDFMNGADGELRSGPFRQVQSGNISAASMKVAIWLTAVMAFFSGLSLLALSDISWVEIIVFVSIGLLSIWAAIRYTAGENPYGYKSLGDLAVFLFFGPIGMIGSAYVLTSELVITSIPASLFTGCISVMVLNLNNLRDESSDRISGKITMVVRFGQSVGRRYHFILFLLATMGALFMAAEVSTICLFVDAGFMLFIYGNQRLVWSHDFQQFDIKMKPLALSAFSFSLLQVLLHNFTL
jgi:1,4-dihydroxy-2-naphthoate octaprenyltransferase